MDTIFKTLYGTISASSNTISFTDDLIIDSTIIDTYFSDDEIVVDDISVTNHTVTITIKEHSTSVGIAVFINNCDEFIPFDDTEILNRLTIVETDTDTLNTEVGTLTNTVNNKQDKLPTVVNDRYLHTNSVTGNLEWSTVQGGSGASYLSELNDVEINEDLWDGQLLRYNMASEKWVNQTIYTPDISHVIRISQTEVYIEPLNVVIDDIRGTIGQVNTSLESV